MGYLKRTQGQLVIHCGVNILHRDIMNKVEEFIIQVLRLVFLWGPIIAQIIILRKKLPMSNLKVTNYTNRD